MIIFSTVSRKNYHFVERGVGGKSDCVRIRGNTVWDNEV